MGLYTKKPVTVEAVQFNKMGDHPAVEIGVGGGHVIEGRQGFVSVNPGDWIIAEANGAGFYPCAPDVFEATYAASGGQAEPASGAKRLSMADIQSVIVSESYHRVSGSTFMVCFLTLRNGFIVTGESACADPDAYDQATGEKYARENAVEKIWTLEGYLLRERLRQPALGDRAHDDLGRVA